MTEEPVIPQFSTHAVLRAAPTIAAGRWSSAEHIPVGFANENWLLGNGSQRALLKIGPPQQDIGKWRAATFAADLAYKAGLPVTQNLGSVERCALLGNRCVRVCTYVEGVGCFTSSDPSRFWRELGTAVRNMHRIEILGFSSRLDGSAPWFDTWGEYLEYRVGQMAARAAASGLFNPAQLGEYLGQISRIAMRLSPHIAPCLTHRDLHADNLVASPDGGLGAILDFDIAEAWDPVADFFKLQYWVFDGRPELSRWFEEGYGDPREVWTRFDERLAVVYAIELINMIANADPNQETSWINRAWDRLDELHETMGWLAPGPEAIRRQPF